METPTSSWSERVSIENNLLSDYSALLVVEHDSQYNDTVFNWPQFWVLGDELDTDETDKLSVFPNPARSVIHVRLKTEEDIDEIRLYDAQGRFLGRYMGEHTPYKDLDIQELPEGTYHLEVLTKHGGSHHSVFIKS
jgi:hypothetical protein